MLEREIQTKILDWLKDHKFWHRRVPVGGVKHAGIRKRNPLKSMPDIMGILPKTQGRIFFIEVKRPGERPDRDQLTLHEELRSHGALVLVAESVQDVERELIKYSVAS